MSSKCKQGVEGGRRAEYVGEPRQNSICPIQEESIERNDTIGIKLEDGTRISVREVHSTANKEQFLSHVIAGRRAIQDLGLVARAEGCERIQYSGSPRVLWIRTTKPNRYREPLWILCRSSCMIQLW